MSTLNKRRGKNDDDVEETHESEEQGTLLTPKEPVDDDDALEGVIDDEKQENLSEEIEHTLRAQSYRGPIPPSGEVAGYKASYIDAPKIIFNMAEKEQDHRITLEQEEMSLAAKQLEENVKIENRKLDHANKGMDYAFASMLVLIVSSVVLTIFGHQVYGAMLGGLTVIVAYFIGGKDYLIKKKTSQEKLPVDEDFHQEE